MDKLETGTFNVGFDDENLISKIEEICPKDVPEASEDESDDNEDDDDVFPEEFDDKVRSCKVCLRLEPALNHSGAKVILASKSLKHWAIVCDFKGRKIQYDLFNASGKLSGGEICPRWTDLGHETKNCLTTTYVLGKIMTCPRNVYKLAGSHAMNGGTYHATAQNCQLWALDLLKNLDPDLYQKVEELKLKTLKERRIAPCVNCCVQVSCASGSS